MLIEKNMWHVDAARRTTPAVSVGMPVYNGETYMRQALDSLLAQSFGNFELIISDNGSTDETELICRKYAERDSRIRYFRQPANLGAAANFRFVLDAAAADFFMWAAADDVWDVRWIETLLPVAAEHGCLAYGVLQTIDADGLTHAHPANFRKFEFSGNRLLRRCRYFVQPAFLGKANPIYGMFPSSCKKLLDMRTLASEKLGGDMLFLFTLLDQIEIRHAGNACLYKRIHDGSIGATINGAAAPPGLFASLAALSRSAVSGGLLGKYTKRSNSLEAIVLSILYPVYIVLGLAHTAIYAIRYKVFPHKGRSRGRSSSSACVATTTGDRQHE